MLEMTIWYHEERDWYAARYASLGLTAYGNSHIDAMRSLVDLYELAYNTHKAKGTLKKWLTRNDVTYMSVVHGWKQDKF